MDPPDLLIARRPVRARVGLGAAIVLVLIGLGVAVIVSALGTRGSSQTAAASPSAKASPSGALGVARSGSTGATIYIHVLGAVAKPGLYLLSDGDRAVDAVGAAGGLTSTADQAGLNLARLLVDGEQILVPNVGEPSGPGADGAGTARITGEKVNLNSADETALQTLPRVGPAMAKRIIDWRKKNGRFTAVEDLMSVTGVGQKTFDELKDLVTL